MTEKIELKVGNPQKIKLKMGQVEPPLKIFLFLNVRFINFFLNPVAQTYQNESAPIFYYAKSKKYFLKLLKIAVLQPLDWIQRKKNTLYLFSKTINLCCTVNILEPDSWPTLFILSAVMYLLFSVGTKTKVLIFVGVSNWLLCDRCTLDIT